MTPPTVNIANVDALLEAALLVSGGDMVIIVTGKRLLDDGFTDLRVYMTGTSGHGEAMHILRHVAGQDRPQRIIQWPDEP